MNTWKKSVVLILIIAVTLTAGTAEEAFDYLCKLRKWTQAGINFNEYSVRFRACELVIKGLGIHSEAERRDTAATALLEVLKHYEFAHEVWAYKYSGPDYREFLPAGSRLAREVIARYPYVVTEGAPGEIIDWIPYSNKAGIRIEQAVSVIFMQAAVSLEDAHKKFFKGH